MLETERVQLYVVGNIVLRQKNKTVWSSNTDRATAIELSIDGVTYRIPCLAADEGNEISIEVN